MIHGSIVILIITTSTGRPTRASSFAFFSEPQDRFMSAGLPVLLEGADRVQKMQGHRNLLQACGGPKSAGVSPSSGIAVPGDVAGGDLGARSTRAASHPSAIAVTGSPRGSSRDAGSFDAGRNQLQLPRTCCTCAHAHASAPAAAGAGRGAAPGPLKKRNSVRDLLP